MPLHCPQGGASEHDVRTRRTGPGLDRRLDGATERRRTMFGHLLTDVGAFGALAIANSTSETRRDRG
jgi:hypothetical protein